MQDMFWEFGNGSEWFNETIFEEIIMAGKTPDPIMAKVINFTVF